MQIRAQRTHRTHGQEPIQARSLRADRSLTQLVAIFQKTVQPFHFSVIFIRSESFRMTLLTALCFFLTVSPIESPDILSQLAIDNYLFWCTTLSGIYIRMIFSFIY